MRIRIRNPDDDAALFLMTMPNYDNNVPNIIPSYLAVSLLVELDHVPVAVLLGWVE